MARGALHRLRASRQRCSSLAGSLLHWSPWAAEQPEPLTCVTKEAEPWHALAHHAGAAGAAVDADAHLGGWNRMVLRESGQEWWEGLRIKEEGSSTMGLSLSGTGQSGCRGCCGC